MEPEKGVRPNKWFDDSDFKSWAKENGVSSKQSDYTREEADDILRKWYIDRTGGVH